MLNFFKKKRSLDQLGKDLKPTLGTRDEAQITKLFDEIIAYQKKNPETVEAHLGWGILVACEFKLNCVGKYLQWFLQNHPNSILPVKIEYADYLAATGEHDGATHLAREYLALIEAKGSLNESINTFPNIQRGVSKAFLLLTAAYTTVGARSYSKRILEFAGKLPLDSTYLKHYGIELQRLDDELAQPTNEGIDRTWEDFFQTGKNADTLFNLCKLKKCEILADRVDLLEANFRINSNYAVEAEERLMLIYEVELNDGKKTRVLESMKPTS